MEAYEAYRDARFLIIDDDRELGDALGGMISGWGIKTKIVTRPSLVADILRNCSFNIVLLDIVMPEKSGFDLVPEIHNSCPDTKIIIMTGYADKEKAIKGLRLGIFDFLEKPIKMEVLSHAVKRALDAQKTELELRKTLRELERSQRDLLAREKKLEEVNEQVLANNKSLSLLAKNLKTTQERSETRIVMKIRSLMIPILEKLQRDKNLKRYEAELSALLAYIENLTSSLAGDMKIFDLLSFSELRIASMIVTGLTSLEIASQLHISLATVETHRKNIRRKLAISHSHHNLRSYLKWRLAKG